MLPAEEPVLSLSEWIVLSLVCEGLTHGLVIVNLLARDGDMGRIWHVPRGVVYRSLDRLVDLGLVRWAGKQHTTQGPARSLAEATEAGLAAATSWQYRPVEHTRDIRSQLLVKLALLDRSGCDPHVLLTAQQELLAPIAGALRERIALASGFDRTMLLWRYESASAAVRFLDALLLTPPVGPPARSSSEGGKLT